MTEVHMRCHSERSEESAILSQGRRCFAALSMTAIAFLISFHVRAAEEIYPKHCNAKSQAAVKKGLDYLAKTQTQDGNWSGTQDSNAYPVTMTSLAGMAFLANGNTPTRGP